VAVAAAPTSMKVAAARVAIPQAAEVVTSESTRQ